LVLEYSANEGILPHAANYYLHHWLTVANIVICTSS